MNEDLLPPPRLSRLRSRSRDPPPSLSLGRVMPAWVALLGVAFAGVAPVGSEGLVGSDKLAGIEKPATGALKAAGADSASVDDPAAVCGVY